MYCQVKDMIPPYIKLIEMIVKSKRQKSEETARTFFPDVQQMMNITYGGIIGYIDHIIEMKRTMKSIRIDEDP